MMNDAVAPLARAALDIVTSPDDVPDATALSVDQLLVTARAHHLGGALLRAVSHRAVVLDDAALAAVQELLREDTARSMALDAALFEASDALEAASIEFRVLKGVAHAHLLYDDPLLRPYHDVDLLVRGDDLHRAVGALRTIGAGRRERALGEDWERRFAKGVSLVRRDSIEIDIHRTLARGPFGVTVEPDTLFDRLSTFSLEGRTFIALAPEAVFLHACLQVITDDQPKPASMLDVVAAGRSPSLDPAAADALADRWGVRTAVAEAVRSSERMSGCSEVSSRFGWIQGYEPSVRDRRVLGCYRARRARWTREALVALPLLDRWSDRWSFARGVAIRR